MVINQQQLRVLLRLSITYVFNAGRFDSGRGPERH